MALDVKLKWQGARLTGVESILRNFAPRFQRAFWLFLEKELRRECLRYVQRRTPARTGKLRGSVRTRARQTGGGFNGYAEVGYEEHYAIWVAAARKVVQGKPLRTKVRKAFTIAFQKALAAAVAAEGRGSGT